MRARQGVPVLAALGAACAIGGLGSLEDAPAHGLSTEVRLHDDRELTGELLVAEDEGLLILAGSRVTFIRWSEIRRARIDGAKGVRRIDSGRTPEADQRRRINLFARYPLGIDDAQKVRLARLMGGTAVDTIDGPGTSGGTAAPVASRPARHPSTPPAGPVNEAFLAEAARASAAFRDVAHARRAGYRPLGPDFPGMGRHWIRPALVVAGVIDPGSPPVLCYVRIDGTTRLAGVAYTLPLAGDEPPPAEPFGRDAWHDHTASVDEESLMLGHPRSNHHRPDGSRLAMVHVWTEVDNPDGIIAQHNWTLPFRRLGLEPPGRIPVAAARALSLVGEGRAYYRDLFDSAADLDGDESERLASVIDRHAARSDAWAERRAVDPGVAPLAELEDIWTSLWEEVRGSVRAEAWEDLAALGSPGT